MTNTTTFLATDIMHASELIHRLGRESTTVLIDSIAQVTDDVPVTAPAPAPKPIRKIENPNPNPRRQRSTKEQMRANQMLLVTAMKKEGERIGGNKWYSRSDLGSLMRDTVEIRTLNTLLGEGLIKREGNKWSARYALADEPSETEETPSGE
jgi:hypothetical protein